MGWWKEANGGLVGDEVLDALDDALEVVRAKFEHDLGEAPSIAEMSMLLSEALGALLDEPVEVVVEATPKRRPRTKRRTPPTAGAEPRAGDLVVLTLEGGAYGLVRVLRVEAGACLAEAIEGVYPTPPALGDIRTLAPLEGGGPGRESSVSRILVVGPLPASASIIGTVPATPAEQQSEALELADWEAVAAAIRAAWQSQED